MFYTDHPGLFLQTADTHEASGWIIYTHSPSFGAGQGRMANHMYRRSIRLRLKDDKPAVATISSRSTESKQSLKTALAGTKWINSNHVSFEWTNDGKLLHNGVERDWKVTGQQSIEINFGSQTGRIVFDDDLTSFKQGRKNGELKMTGRRQ